MPLSSTNPQNIASTDNWIAIACGTPDRLSGYALVLAAMEIDWIEDGSCLLVPEPVAETARGQLQAYEEENRNWPPPPAWLEREKEPLPRPPTLVMIGMLFLFFQITGPWDAASPWFANGAIDSRQILAHGEWWRLFTALTLHADANHLLGNVLIGGFIVHLLCRTIGYGTAWLLLLLTGGLGNYVNIALRGQEHHAVGFSTAVFAAIGMFSGLRLHGEKGASGQVLIALGAGAGLLAFLGSEGKQTDLGAHLFGFACGILVGLMARITGLADTGADIRRQRSLLLLSLTLITLCWWLALHGGRLFG
jgi:membrane associated rhomboid family serine protease